MIRASAQVERPDDANLTLTVTMTVGEWKRLIDQLRDSPTFTSHPACNLIPTVRYAIEETVGHVSNQVEAAR